ncbi:helix-turn-helix domain-containing protein [Amycolatopsis sp. FBCC-B4732]|uniref:helix-turn-helix domain-containing protein n=1 Tax=Amycolatopsis sp. FBCC-B4732 TaxID=3079339 RepID=UPI001FF13AFB|nr:helix-turn-helix domain-containing protein [Amycolatopsis sp. FBCC-B4732]UOX89994.1 helix-turn-helix domain-containing protein [Amycolatopsis sp. FBCC-B4732]
MSAPSKAGTSSSRHPTLAAKLDYLFTTVLREVTDKEHARAVAAAGGDHTIERALRPWTYAEVATAVGSTPEYIGYLRRGEKDNPTIKVLRKLATVFGVPVSYLAEDDTDPVAEVDQRVAATHAGQGDQTLADRLNACFDAVRPGGGDQEYTDVEVAEAIDCAPEDLQGLRAGADVDIGIRSLRKLAALFGVTVSYLVDGTAAERVNPRLAVLRDLREAGVLQLALELAKVKTFAGREAMAQMVQAFLQVETAKRDGGAKPATEG